MPDFNLVSEKWIPCILSDGHSEDFNLLDTLTKAHQIKEIFDSSPLITASLHRFLLAILHRNFGPPNMGEWREIWKRKRFDETKLKDYLAKNKSGFNLFDTKRPFYQTLELPKTEKHPILHLALEIASGNNATLFDHNFDEYPDAISPATATRYVIAIQSYAIGFGRSNPFYFADSPLIRGLMVLAIGNNLFETLMLNFIEYNERLPFPHSGEDLPIWEQNNPAVPDSNGTSIKGYLDYLTWQSRSIHLFPEGDPTVVRQCQIQQNLKLPRQQYFDPFKCFSKNKEKGYVALPLRPDKALWRNSIALFQITDDSFKRPDIINWLARIENGRQEGRIQAQQAYSLEVIGLATDIGKAASVLLWRHERLPLPLQFLVNDKLVAKLKEALGLSEDIARNALNSAIWNLAKLIIAPEADNLNDNQKKEINNFCDSLASEKSYWAQLGIAFPKFLMALANDVKEVDNEVIYGHNSLPGSAIEVRSAAWQAFREATNSLNYSTRIFKAVTIAENNFSLRMNSILKDFLMPYQNVKMKGEKA